MAMEACKYLETERELLVAVNNNWVAVGNLLFGV